MVMVNLGSTDDSRYTGYREITDRDVLDLQCNIIQGTCSTSFGIWQLCLGSQGVVLQQEIKKVQNRAARFVTSNYCFETGSMTEALQGVLGNRGIRPFISGEQRNKSLKLKGTGETPEERQFWGTGNIENQDFDFGE